MQLAAGGERHVCCGPCVDVRMLSCLCIQQACRCAGY
jgi:hypothetical protein